MNSVLNRCFLVLLLLPGEITKAQTTNQSPTLQHMNASVIKKNTAVIVDFYNRILNQRKLEALGIIVSEKYTNTQGGKGLEGFTKGISELLEGFDDMQWTISEIIADENKVIVNQRVNGTHTGTFKGIPATGKKISNEGFAIYYMEGGKIISHQIMTDRLTFFQQLGIIPENPFATVSQDSIVYFVDRFRIPVKAYAEFVRQMQYNRKFIKTLPGFINDTVISRTEENDSVILITIAAWQGEAYLRDAKTSVQEEYKRIQFNPGEFLKHLDITMEREQFRNFISANSNNH